MQKVRGSYLRAVQAGAMAAVPPISLFLFACVTAADPGGLAARIHNLLPSEPSPIIVATDKNGRYELTSAAEGVAFDIDGDGAVEQVAWTAAGSDVAFLAVDRDGNGLITSGRELFGNNTLRGATNGFAALQQMAAETNGGILRGSVSSDDPLFERLLLWTDANHNGFSELTELRPASESLSDIGLGYTMTDRRDRHGNIFRFQGWAHVRTKPGRNRARGPEEENERRITIWDVYLRVAAPRER
jgi:hypothetical protein